MTYDEHGRTVILTEIDIPNNKTKTCIVNRKMSIDVFKTTILTKLGLIDHTVSLFYYGRDGFEPFTQDHIPMLEHCDVIWVKVI
jgi:hypothetical protein